MQYTSTSTVSRSSPIIKGIYVFYLGTLPAFKLSHKLFGRRMFLSGNLIVVIRIQEQLDFWSETEELEMMPCWCMKACTCMHE